jgi:hypothetical protein
MAASSAQEYIHHNVFFIYINMFVSQKGFILTNMNWKKLKFFGLETRLYQLLADTYQTGRAIVLQVKLKGEWKDLYSIL